MWVGLRQVSFHFILIHRASARKWRHLTTHTLVFFFPIGISFIRLFKKMVFGVRTVGRRPGELLFDQPLDVPLHRIAHTIFLKEETEKFQWKKNQILRKKEVLRSWYFYNRFHYCFLFMGQRPTAVRIQDIIGLWPLDSLSQPLNKKKTKKSITEKYKDLWACEPFVV